MANSYITLANSNSTLSKKFPVIFGGLNNSYAKNESIRDTVDGGIEHCVGSIRHIQRLTVKTWYTPPTGYGSVADLRTLYMLKNPNATPSNIIKYTDHFNNPAWNVLLHGTFDENLLTIEIDNGLAIYIVNLNLLFLN